jgi:hypothetical protein
LLLLLLTNSYFLVITAILLQLLLTGITLDIMYGSVDHLINSYVRSNTDGEMHSHANLLLEFLMMKHGMLELSDSHYFTKTVLDCFVHFVNFCVLCT